MGEFAARNMVKKRKRFRWSPKAGKKKLLKLWKDEPLKGAPTGRGIVLKKKGVEQKQPHSGIIKCVRVQLIKNGVQVTAFVPGTNAIKFIDEHDEVTIVGVGGSQKSAVGSMHGIKYKVVEVNGASLNELLKGKKEKPKTA
ncbi:MAG: 30S ribosomal protein S12 [Candidatus Aenigmatarchaeota archaeon]|nr:MAG: 30S ribosomal protein S12 [Candidatus Aenigmarchaeota archaeon]